MKSERVSVVHRLVGVARRVAVLVAVGSIGACGRSEKIGWRDREPPSSDSMAALRGADQGQTQATPPRSSTSPADAPQALMREYQQLSQSLVSTRDAAMQDDSLGAAWRALSDDVNQQMKKENPYYGQLMDRADQIQRRVVAAQQGGDSLSTQERASMAQQWQAIQSALGQGRSQVLQEPEFASRLGAFQDRLYEKMKQHSPDRADDIDRLRVVGDRLSTMLDSMAAARDTAARDRGR